MPSIARDDEDRPRLTMRPDDQLDPRVIDARIEDALRFVAVGHTYQRCREHLKILFLDTVQDGRRLELADRDRHFAQLQERR